MATFEQHNNSLIGAGETSYVPEPGNYSAWDEMISVLYSPEERHKIEWAIGSIVAGASKDIQKFYVFYGAPKTGKSTILNIIEKLFQGYIVVAIQQDGDLSRIEDNMRFATTVFIETNKPVKITDSKSSILRRLIDISPTNDRIPSKRYDQLNAQVTFELGGIAWHCKEVFEEDPKYYDNYTPTLVAGSI